MNQLAISAAPVWMRSGPALRGCRRRPRPRKACSKINQSGNIYRHPVFALCALLLTLAPWAAAQRSPSHAAATRPTIPHFNVGSHAFAQSAHLSRFRSAPYTSLPFPFFTDFFNPDDVYSTGYPVASQPPIILLPAARNMAGSSEYLSRSDNYSKPTLPQPLVIELKNGHYVRINSTPANGEVLTAQPGSTDAKENAKASPAHDLPPAVLVFRDGHNEEVRDYTIADGILYARGDYYLDGYWNKKIDLANLNVAQTLEANASRSVKFILPASPNEVITRP